MYVYIHTWAGDMSPPLVGGASGGASGGALLRHHKLSGVHSGIKYTVPALNWHASSKQLNRVQLSDCFTYIKVPPSTQAYQGNHSGNMQHFIHSKR